MPSGYDSAREPLLKRMFFGDSTHNQREEKVLQYVIHRMKEDVHLDDVMHEDYVRRNCSQSEIERIVSDPELVHACREHLWRTFESGELNPGRVRHGSPPSAQGIRTVPRDTADPALPST